MDIVVATIAAFVVYGLLSMTQYAIVQGMVTRSADERTVRKAICAPYPEIAGLVVALTVGAISTAILIFGIVALASVSIYDYFRLRVCDRPPGYSAGVRRASYIVAALRSSIFVFIASTGLIWELVRG